MLDVRRLAILREVAARGSFSAAADSLYLSQPAVSQQVATLEREVGMSLLERTKSGPKLTDAGRVLVRHADAAISRLEEAERELSAIAGLEGGELKMASFPSASASLLTIGLRDFAERHPKVRLSVIEAEPEESLPLLRAGDLDLAMTFDYPAVASELDPDLDRTLLLTESMYVALPQGHRLAGDEIVSLAELETEDWLGGIRPSSCGVALVTCCHSAGFDPNVTFESDDYNVLQGYVAAGLGVTLLPDLALLNLRHDLVVRPTEPAAPVRRVWAATRTEDARSRAAAAMVAILVEAGQSFAERIGDPASAGLAPTH